MAYEFYLGDNITAYVEGENRTQTTNGYIITIIGDGAMYASRDNFRKPDSQTFSAWNSVCYYCKQAVLEIPDGITTIARQAFEGLGDYWGRVKGEAVVRSVVIPNSVEIIGERGFASSYTNEFPRIKHFYMGNSVREVGANAFAYQMSAITLDFHGSVELVGNGSFRDCRLVEELNLSDDWDIGSVTGGTVNTFENCYNLKKISQSNIIRHLDYARLYYKCNNLQRVKIIETSAIPSLNGISMYVDIGEGSVLDDDGYFITEVSEDSNIVELLNRFDTKRNWHRIIVWYSEFKVYLYHMGRIIEISGYDDGALPLKHEDIYKFLRWIKLNGKNSDMSQTPLHVAHKGHWYQIVY